MATYTATAADTHQPLALTSGLVAKVGKISGNILTVTDIVQMLKLPDRATVVEGIVQMSSGGSYTISVGDGGSAARFGTFSVSGALTNFRFTMPIVPYQLSLTANAPNKFDTVDLTITSVTGSATASMSMTLFYLTDGQS